jgi:excinuclease ABC subunit C
LESRLIKKFKPFYNIISKDDKSPYFIHITKETYPKPILNHTPNGAVAGPFLNRYTPTKILRQLRHVTPFCVAPRPVRKPCFYSHLGLCKPCPGSDAPIAVYQTNINSLKKMLSGHFSAVAHDIKSKMLIASRNQDFETAALLRDHLENLNHLLATPIAPDDYIVNPNLTDDTRQAALLSLESALAPPLNLRGGGKGELFHRIEFYDNAHLSGTSPTAAMTVAVSGRLSPQNYRHFTITSASSRNDVAMMQEVLSRRLARADWPIPDLIVLDGGLPQLSILPYITPPPPLKLRGGAPQGEGDIAVIALAKSEELLYFPDGKTLKLSKTHPGLQLLQSLRDEAHRFSRRLHHLHRSKALLKDI